MIYLETIFLNSWDFHTTKEVFSNRKKSQEFKNKILSSILLKNSKNHNLIEFGGIK